MRRAVLIAALAVLVPAAGWSWFWFKTAAHIEDEARAWAALRRAEGMEVAYAGLAVSGFPLGWQVSVTGPVLAGAGATAWRWEGEAGSADVRPWSLRDIPLRFPGRHGLRAGDATAPVALTLRAARPEGTLRLAEDGRLRELILDLGDAEWSYPPDAAITRAARVALSLRPYRTAGATHTTDTLDATLELAGVALPAAPPGELGARIEAALLDLSVKGALPRGRTAAAVRAWRDDGGTIEVNRSRLSWGPFGLDGSGTLALDGQNRPIGAFTARMRGYAPMIDTLVAAGLVRAREAAGAKIALNLLARATPGGAPGEASLPLSAQDGMLAIAGIPLLRLQPLKLD